MLERLMARHPSIKFWINHVYADPNGLLSNEREKERTSDKLPLYE